MAFVFKSQFNSALQMKLSTHLSKFSKQSHTAISNFISTVLQQIRQYDQ